MDRVTYTHDRAELTAQLSTVQTEHALAVPGSVEAEALDREVALVHAQRVTLDIAFMKANPATTGILGINP